MLYRRSTVPTVWDEMERLQRQMNRLFDDFNPGDGHSFPDFPAVNLWSSSEGAMLTAELPGVKHEDIDISVVGDALTLTGKREPEKVGKDVRFHRQERSFGQFVRSIELPFTVDANKVEAVFEKGVLYVHLPRTEAEMPKKISVKSR
jgi:HSP20 family protein